MSGAEPMLIGAALGGGLSAARGGNPLQGALLGGVTGGIGGSIWGAAADAAGSAAATEAAAGMAAQPALSYAGAQTAAGTAAANPGFMATLGAFPQAAWNMAKANPAEAFQGVSLANQMMTPHHQMQMPGASPLLHGQAPQAQSSYLSLLPKPQAISLI
jgi:hypothetical protein